MIVKNGKTIIAVKRGNNYAFDLVWNGHLMYSHNGNAPLCILGDLISSGSKYFMYTPPNAMTFSSEYSKFDLSYPPIRTNKNGTTLSVYKNMYTGDLAKLGHTGHSIVYIDKESLIPYAITPVGAPSIPDNCEIVLICYTNVLKNAALFIQGIPSGGVVKNVMATFDSQSNIESYDIKDYETGERYEFTAKNSYTRVTSGKIATSDLDIQINGEPLNITKLPGILPNHISTTKIIPKGSTVSIVGVSRTILFSNCVEKQKTLVNTVKILSKKEYTGAFIGRATDDAGVLVWYNKYLTASDGCEYTVESTTSSRGLYGTNIKPPENVSAPRLGFNEIPIYGTLTSASAGSTSLVPIPILNLVTNQIYTTSFLYNKSENVAKYRLGGYNNNLFYSNEPYWNSFEFVTTQGSITIFFSVNYEDTVNVEIDGKVYTKPPNTYVLYISDLEPMSVVKIDPRVSGTNAIPDYFTIQDAYGIDLFFMR